MSLPESLPDRALWINWYDLLDEDVSGHQAWLHEWYLPRILMVPGVLHAAHYRVRVGAKPNSRITTDLTVPTGKAHVVIVGARDAHVFSKSSVNYSEHRPDPHVFDSTLDTAAREMLAMRRGLRTCIATEEARTLGPQSHRRDERGTLGPFIQLGAFNVPSVAAEDELMAWYAQWRSTAFAAMPGCLGFRNLVTVSGWAKHIVVYEFCSEEDREVYPNRLSAMSKEMEEWTRRVIAGSVHAPGSPSIGDRLWPNVGE